MKALRPGGASVVTLFISPIGISSLRVKVIVCAEPADKVGAWQLENPQARRGSVPPGFPAVAELLL